MKKEALYALFQEKKFRLTQARRGLIQLLVDSPAPLSAPQILVRLKRAGIKVDKTTVYRELDRWEKLGLLEKVRLSDEEASYELKRKHHHHLVCLQCENSEDVVLDESAIEEEERRLSEKACFRAVRHSLEFFGLCKQCQS